MQAGEEKRKMGGETRPNLGQWPPPPPACARENQDENQKGFQTSLLHLPQPLSHSADLLCALIHTHKLEMLPPPLPPFRAPSAGPGDGVHLSRQTPLPFTYRAQPMLSPPPSPRAPRGPGFPPSPSLSLRPRPARQPPLRPAPNPGANSHPFRIVGRDRILSLPV